MQNFLLPSHNKIYYTKTQFRTTSVLFPTPADLLLVILGIAVTFFDTNLSTSNMKKVPATFDLSKCIRKGLVVIR